MKILSLFIFILPLITQAQNAITGTFPALANQRVILTGFEGFTTYSIDNVKANEQGIFTLSFSEKDYGMAYIAAEDDKAFIVILTPGENLLLKGEALADPKSVSITSGKQNLLFGQYAGEHPRREQALSAWDYLERIYELDPLFANHQISRNAIEAEKQRIKQEDLAFLQGLDPQSYVSWFLPVRKLVSSVPTIAQYRTAEIPNAIAAFRKMDYTDRRLYKSGLLRETIETHFWLIENSGRSLDSVFIEMYASIDHIISHLASDEKKFNEITQYLFNLLEQRSLFGASEYLAIKILNEVSCTVDDNFASQLESYRAMKVGNIAPDIFFDGDITQNGQNILVPKRLSEIQADYFLLVFGSAGCPMCSQEISQIRRMYPKWKSINVEVLYVSLDTEEQEFKNFTLDFPFISYSNYQQWNTPAAKDYFIFATPTMFLLDANRKIILRPNSVRQADAWVDWYIMQRNQ